MQRTLPQTLLLQADEAAGYYFIVVDYTDFMGVVREIGGHSPFKIFRLLICTVPARLNLIHGQH